MGKSQNLFQSLVEILIPEGATETGCRKGIQSECVSEQVRLGRLGGARKGHRQPEGSRALPQDRKGHLREVGRMTLLMVMRGK